MVTIKLAHAWTYRTPEKTINYPAGEPEVFQYIADAAEADGALTKENADGDADQPATADAPRAARSRKG